MNPKSYGKVHEYSESEKENLTRICTLNESTDELIEKLEKGKELFFKKAPKTGANAPAK